jgi:hypothetical protein
MDELSVADKLGVVGDVLGFVVLVLVIIAAVYVLFSLITAGTDRTPDEWKKFKGLGPAPEPRDSVASIQTAEWIQELRKAGWKASPVIETRRLVALSDLRKSKEKHESVNPDSVV